VECVGTEVADLLRASWSDTRPSVNARGDKLDARVDHFASECEIAEASATRFDPGSLEDTALIVLIDQSGSMWGKAPDIAAHVAKASARLEQAGAKVRVAGFTSVGWKGGRSRTVWLEQGKPSYPGRLCDRLHVVYSDFDEGIRSDQFEPLLTSYSMFENLDGEALEWAEETLRARPDAQRGILIISDGAPVDDSTLVANGNAFLWRHLNQVIKRLESDPEIGLGAIGIDYRVDSLYQLSTSIEDTTQLSDAILEIATSALKRE